MLAASVSERRGALQRVVDEWKEGELAHSDTLMGELRITKTALRNAAGVSSLVAQRTGGNSQTSASSDTCYTIAALTFENVG